MNTSYVFESLGFIFTNSFFKGLSAKDVKSYVITDSLSDAYEFAFEQNLSSPYKVWKDAIENNRKDLRVHDKFDDAEEVVNEYLANLQIKHAGILLEYRKRKVKKLNTDYDDFLFSDAREDAFFVLSAVAINRFLDNPLLNSLLEEIFDCYKKGGWPCGLKGHDLIVFDPSALKK
ncbi:hypothetical protein HF650_01320 [Kosakonia sp. SMBL-WEM22]|uniref:hypothetical protein n=1 Tax=Kosakonia sp. SMBL-WEM22 TaxID=2725560 RepID=UPI001658CD6A|nr:hypothetical protein [Kosakonia sp. SMBL-WEM22]QNQ18518.1 hypothetical protein HF650_01320 [Kosakonia sp. SMBL-WEM22]